MRQDRSLPGLPSGDDQLLDGLCGAGRLADGNRVATDRDEVTTWLAVWRDDLSADIRPVPLDLDAVLPAVAASANRRARWRRLVAGSGVALAIAGGGGAVAMAAGEGQPGGVLWPVTQLVYPERAESRVAQQDAQQLLETARLALTDQRHADAQRLVGEAGLLIDEVTEPAEHHRLAAELAEVRTLLASVAPVLETPLPPGTGLERPEEAPEVEVPEVPIPRPTLPEPPVNDPRSGATPAPPPPAPPESSLAPPESTGPTDPTDPTDPTLPLPPLPPLIP